MSDSESVVDTWARPVGRGEIASMLSIKPTVIKDSAWSKGERVISRPGDIFRDADRDLTKHIDLENQKKRS